MNTFEIEDRVYSYKDSWLLSARKQCITASSLSLFVSSALHGFAVMENFEDPSSLTEVSIAGQPVVSLELSPSASPDLAIVFASGNIFVLDPIQRSKGRVIRLGYNSLYSDKKPSLLRWINSEFFAVVFEDASMWVFNKDFLKEDYRIVSFFKSRLAMPSDLFAFATCLTDKNPTEAWKFSIGKINDLQMRNNIFAVATENGYVNLFSFQKKKHLFTFKSYFGGFLCVALNHVENLVAAGGEDDAVSVWSVEGKRLNARCQGHNSWVSSVKFDIEMNDLLFSIGHDGLMMLWKIESFSVDNHVSSEYPSREMTKIVAPLMQVVIKEEPLHALAVNRKCVYVADAEGLIHLWILS